MKYSFPKLMGSNSTLNYKSEILAGLTVALAFVPQAIAFAIVAGFSPLTGLYAAFVVGLITALFGGRPAMISGSAGAIVVIFLGLILELRAMYPDINNEQILHYVFATVIIAGVIQIIVGVLKLGKFVSLVPSSVMSGFLNGLAIMIVMAQLPFITPIIHNNMSLSSLFSFSSVGNFDLLWKGLGELGNMIGFILLTMFIIWRLPKITKIIPSPLAAIIVVSGIVFIFGVDTTVVSDALAPGQSIKGGFPPISIPQIPIDWQTMVLIFPYAVIMAVVGLLESLLTLNIVDEITETRGDTNRECVAQGVANISSGFLSGMGGCGIVGQSLINTSSGGRTRLSAVVAAVMLLVFVMFGSSVIEILPMPALIGVMFMVAIGTFEWASLRTFRKMPISDVFVMVAVTLITVITHNLAIAVLLGVIFSALVYAWENAKRIRARKYIDNNGVKYYEIYGPLFFASVKTFAEKFDPINDPSEVVVDFAESRVVDMSAIEMLNSLTERYRKQNKRIHLRHLSADCRRLLSDASAIIDVNVMEDPIYHVAIDDNVIKIPSYNSPEK